MSEKVNISTQPMPSPEAIAQAMRRAERLRSEALADGVVWLATRTASATRKLYRSVTTAFARLAAQHHPHPDSVPRGGPLK